MILNQAQAEAVYSAMCALNNVGGLLFTTICETGGFTIRIKQLAERDVIEIWAQVEDQYERATSGQERESHADQAAFATAYGLNRGA